ncbi:2-oxoacid:acceptor oxidoreductase family protein [Desulfosporosinus sp. FKB]|uniref:2-oxoacid:acceptor oxidoreductase family protein n=1 Tax=Desulfosporosinus sp. FKB TaxID=1969835 RepID=UPI000B49D259|nr:2-oxoacid:acceptor oxidoreductase family protein [Desulfosporosinus sp. FKB]
MIEICFHGRYGQAVQKLARSIGNFALNNEKKVQVFDSFSAVRPGAPMYSIVRVADEIIRERSANNPQPDVVIVLDNSLVNVVDVLKGLKSGGTVMALNMEQEVLGGKAESINFVALNPYFADNGSEIEKNLLLALTNQGIL